MTPIGQDLHTHATRERGARPPHPSIIRNPNARSPQALLRATTVLWWRGAYKGWSETTMYLMVELRLLLLQIAKRAGWKCRWMRRLVQNTCDNTPRCEGPPCPATTRPHTTHVSGCPTLAHTRCLWQTVVPLYATSEETTSTREDACNTYPLRAHRLLRLPRGVASP